MFQCAEIRRNEILLDKDNLPDAYTKCPCLISTVMLGAEDQLKNYLQQKSLHWLSQQVKEKVPEEHGKAIVEWFNNPKGRKI